MIYDECTSKILHIAVKCYNILVVAFWLGAYRFSKTPAIKTPAILKWSSTISTVTYILGMIRNVKVMGDQQFD